MSKDGTLRGGPRSRSGPKVKVTDKIKVIDFTDDMALPEPPELDGMEMPKTEDYLKDTQKDGTAIPAERIFRNMWLWLKKYGCEDMVPTQVIETYAMAYSRAVQCEKAISSYGFLARHPTTNQPTQSPYVAMLDGFRKQQMAAWYSIYSTVKDNLSLGASSLADDPMEKLLTGKR